MNEIRKEGQELVDRLAGLANDLDDLLCCVSQVFDDWHADGTAWSEWDESIRQRVSLWRSGFPELLMTRVRSHTNALIGAEVEACAKAMDMELRALAKQEDGKDEMHPLTAGEVYGWTAAKAKIRSLAPEAAREELERIKAEARLEAINAIFDGMNGGWTAAKVWEYACKSKTELESAARPDTSTEIQAQPATRDSVSRGTDTAITGEEAQRATLGVAVHGGLPLNTPQAQPADHRETVCKQHAKGRVKEEKNG